VHIVCAVSRKEAKPATPGFDVTGLGREGFMVSEDERPPPGTLMARLKGAWPGPPRMSTSRRPAGVKHGGHDHPVSRAFGPYGQSREARVTYARFASLRSRPQRPQAEFSCQAQPIPSAGWSNPTSRRERRLPDRQVAEKRGVGFENPVGAEPEGTETGGGVLTDPQEPSSSLDTFRPYAEATLPSVITEATTRSGLLASELARPS